MAEHRPELRETRFKELRSLIAWQAIMDFKTGEETAPLRNAMLSLAIKKQEAGDVPCPGWVELEDEARELISG